MADTDSGGRTPEAPTQSAKTSRAGRDLPAAIGVSLLLGGTIIAILLFAPRLWVALVAAGMAVATHEVVRRLRTAGYSIPVIPLLIGGQAMIWLTWPFGAAGALGGFGATVLVCLIWRLLGQGLKGHPVNYLRDVSATIFIAAWIPLCGAFAVLLVYPADGWARVFALMLGVTFSDIGGYTAGVLFGKHRMVPEISPKKSWEGFAGSLICGTAGAMLAVVFFMDKPAWVGIPLGVMLVLTATLGDLVESQVKRDLGIKDMGTLLPGHGGLMDRIDGVLPSSVATWIVLTLLA
ncbi:MAG: phosphatidate cytidylyltransferase [Mycobacterium sp.]